MDRVEEHTGRQLQEHLVGRVGEDTGEAKAPVPPGAGLCQGFVDGKAAFTAMMTQKSRPSPPDETSASDDYIQGWNKGWHNAQRGFAGIAPDPSDQDPCGSDRPAPTPPKGGSPPPASRSCQGWQDGESAFLAMKRDGVRPSPPDEKSRDQEYINSWNHGWHYAQYVSMGVEPEAADRSPCPTAPTAASRSVSPLAAQAPPSVRAARNSPPPAVRSDPATPVGHYVIEGDIGGGQTQIQGEFYVYPDGTYRDVLYKKTGRWSLDRTSGGMTFTGSLNLGPATFFPDRGRGKRGMIVFQVKPDVKQWAYRTGG